MPTSFPSSVDTFTNPAPSDGLNSVTAPHSEQHANANDAITAVETFILDHDPRGVTGGQTMVGGTGAGDDLLLRATSHATPGDIIFQSEPGVETARVFASGGFANTLWMRIGNLSAPVNTTAGDITVSRLNIGNNVISASRLPVVQVDHTGTGTSGIKNGGLFQYKSAPTSNSTAITRAWEFVVNAESPSGITHSLDSVIYSEVRVEQSGNITSAAALEIGALLYATGSPASRGTITNLDGIRIQPFYSNNPTTVSGNVTNFDGIDILAAATAGLTVGTFKGLTVKNQANLAVTNLIGIDVEALTAGSAQNIGIRNAAPYVATPSSVQAISGAAASILANAGVVQINANGNYSLTSTPTIANGQNGQILTIVNVDSAETITLQDEAVLAGSNLRLPGGSNLALGPRDAVVLMFITALNDWVTISYSNN